MIAIVTSYLCSLKIKCFSVAFYGRFCGLLRFTRPNSYPAFILAYHRKPVTKKIFGTTVSTWRQIDVFKWHKNHFLNHTAQHPKLNPILTKTVKALANMHDTCIRHRY